MKMIVDDVETTIVYFDFDEGVPVRIGGRHLVTDAEDNSCASAYTIRAEDFHETITEAEAEESSLGLGTYPPSLVLSSDIGKEGFPLPGVVLPKHNQ
jgi:hypothetical protein